MKEMVNAFSDYARSPVMRPMSIDLNTLVLDVVELYRTASPAVRFDTRLERPLNPVFADPDRLQQVLHNLLTNAVEACGDNDQPWVSVETRTGSADSEDMVRLTVHDSGAGFPEDIVDRMFEPYVTSKPKGSGLGLAIAKKLVEEHGGIVAGRNSTNGGARITVFLPALKASPMVALHQDPATLRPNL